MKITIVSLTYNQLPQLKKLYESLLKQKDYIKEWVLYDDVSTDGTKEWVKEIKLPLKYIYGEKRPSVHLTANINCALKAVSDGLILLIFADSYLREDALKNLSESYIPNTFGNAYKLNVTQEGKFVSKHYLFESEDVVNIMSSSEPWQLCSGNGMITTKDILERIGYFDEEYRGYGVDDYDIAMRALMNGALLFLYANVKVYHIDHPTKETSSDNKRRYLAKMNGEGYRL